MSVGVSSEATARLTGALAAFRSTLREGSRYLLASTMALILDAGIYIGLIRLFEVHYLVAAPVGFVFGVVAIYALSISWVFTDRRLTNVRAEFGIFVLIGVAGLLLNEAIIYYGVETVSLSYEVAKLVSAAMIFGVNFCARKVILFTRY